MDFLRYKAAYYGSTAGDEAKMFFKSSLDKFYREKFEPV